MRFPDSTGPQGRVVKMLGILGMAAVREQACKTENRLQWGLFDALG